ncbi:HNH endonuclease [Maricaulis sp.]|uniref:HNH endonuclease n=1 Tax=Maricaulis sp. TaxID=1486257 RepID=UPI003A8D6BAE
MLAEVYEIVGTPILTADLGFDGRRILRNAYDSVIRYDDQIEHLFEALQNWPVRKRTELVWPPNFTDPGKVILCGSLYPTVKFASTEGRRRWKLSREAERRGPLRKAALDQNRLRNDGQLVCEACNFSDEEKGMFDAHHLYPIAAGERVTRVDDLAILCPRCHRWAHHKSEDPLTPLPINQIASAIQG